MDPIDRQEELVSLLYRFNEAQKSNKPDLVYRTPGDRNFSQTIYSPAVREIGEKILALFGQEWTAIH